MYEERVIAFLDILGWRSFVTASDADSRDQKSLLRALQVLRRPQQEMEKILSVIGWEKQWRPFQCTQFSDSIVISAHLDEGIDTVVKAALDFSRTLLGLGFFLRGGLTIGRMYHQDAFAFGPGLTAAYDVESQRAVYPRVVIDPGVEGAFLDREKIHDVDGTLLGRWKMFRKGEDGLRFLDFLQPLSASEGERVPNPHNPRGDMAAVHLDSARFRIEWGLEQHQDGDQRIYEKYRWLADYHNSVRSEYPDCGAPVIRYSPTR